MNAIKKIVMGLAVASAAVFCSAADIYVAKTGHDDTGDGTSGNPYETITKGIAVAKEAGGGTVRVGEGTYEENSLVLDAAITVISDDEDRSKVTVHNTDWAKQTFVISAAGAAIRHLTIQGPFTGSSQNSNTLVGGCLKMTADGEVTDCEILNGVSGHSGTGGNVWMSAGRLARCYIHHGNGGHGGYNYAPNIYAEGASVIENCLMANGTAPGTASKKASVYLKGTSKMINCTVVKSSYGVVCDATTAQAVNCVIYDNGGTKAKEWGNANGGCFVNCAFVDTIDALPHSSCVRMTTDDFTDYDGGDYTPTADGVLVDAGKTALYAANGATSATDLANNPRVFGIIDIGAYEAQPATLAVEVDSSANNVTAGTPVTLTATAFSAKGEIAWAWKVDGGDFTAGTATYAFTPSADGIYTIVAKATAGGETAEATKVIRAIAAGTPVDEAWVGSTGDDVKGAGLAESPFATIAHAKAFLAAHPAEGAAQTIHLLPGTYVEYGIVLDGAYVVQGEGESRDDVIIDANLAGTAVKLTNAGAVLANLTVRNGKAVSGNGGNVSISAGLVTNCVLTAGQCSSSKVGGNLYMTGASTLIVDTELVGGKTYSGDGNGICADVTAGRFVRCVFRDVTSTAGNQRPIYYRGDVTFENCLFTRFSVTGIYGCVFYRTGGTITLINCTIVGNRTGGNVFSAPANVRVYNTVIFDNGGTAAKEWGNASAANFVNCAFAKDIYTGTASTVLDLTKDDFVDYEGGDYTPAKGSKLQDAGNKAYYTANGATSETDLAANPRFVDNLDIGAYEAQPTEFTLRVEASAGVIDPADSSVIKGTVFAAPGAVTWAWKVDDGEFVPGEAKFNLTGLPEGVHTITAKVTAGGESLEKATVIRIVAAGTPVDEAWVGSTGDDVKGAGVTESPFATIAHAKEFLAAHPNGAAQTIRLLTGVFVEYGIVLDGAYVVRGEGESRDDVIIDANLADTAVKLTNAGAVLANLTVRNGKAVSGNGGNVNISAGLVTNCVLTAGQCSNTKTGGNLYMTGASTLIVDTELVGGQAYSGDGNGTCADVTAGRFVRCVFRDVTSTANNQRSIYYRGDVTFENCLFTRFSVTGLYGCVFYRSDGILTLVNCTIVGNRTGGNVFSVPANVRVYNTVIFDNGGTAAKEWGGGSNAGNFVNCAFAANAAYTGTTSTVLDLTKDDFVDYDGGDYMPAIGSKFQDRGSNGDYDSRAVSPIALNTVARKCAIAKGAPEVIDIGAYERETSNEVVARLEGAEVAYDGVAHPAVLTIVYPAEGAGCTVRWTWTDGSEHDAPELPVATGAYTNGVVVSTEGLGDFKAETEVTIRALDLTQEADFAKVPTVAPDGLAHYPTPTVTNRESRVEIPATDYHYEYVGDCTSAGRHVVKIVGNGNATGTVEIPFYIFDGTAYVATDGNDETGTGTASEPFETIKKAIEVARAAIDGGAESATVRVGAGTYEADSLVLDAAITVISDAEDRSKVKVCNPSTAPQSVAYQAGYTFQLTVPGAALRHLTIQGSLANNNNQNSMENINGQCVRMTADGEVTDCEILNGVSGHSGTGGNVWMSAGRLARCYIHHGNGGHGGYNYAPNVYAEGASVIENCLMANGTAPGSTSTKASVYLKGSAKMINCTVVKSNYGVVCGAKTAQVINTIIYNTSAKATEWGDANGECFVNCAFINTIDALPNTTTCVRMTTDDFTDYANGDYRLNKSGSVLKGAGTKRDVYDTYATSPTDLIGTPWGLKKLDIGCYAAKAAGLMLILR